MEVHGRHLAKLRVLLVKVKTLRLANVGASSDGQIHHLFLLNLPDCLVDLTERLRNIRDLLHATIVCNNQILDLCCPETNLEQVSY